VRVYDATEQFLGYLVNDNPMKIFVPGLERVASFDFDGDIETASVFFESPDCTGQPYRSAANAYSVFTAAGRFYTGRNVAPVSRQMQSQLPSSGSCMRMSSSFLTVMAPLQEVALPFVVPLALPLRFGQ
jgi:hypothetical protein